MFVCLSAFSALYTDSDLRDLVKKEAEDDLKNSALSEEDLAKEIKAFEEGLDELT